MVAADDDGCLQLARFHHVVEHQPRTVTVAQPDPADAGGQALEGDAFLRHVEPAVKVGVFREQPLHRGVGGMDVRRIARERAPPEGADAPAEEGADIGRDEAGEGEGVLQPLILCHLSDIVAIIQRRHACVPEIHHRGDMGAHGGAGGFLHLLGGGFLFRAPFGGGPACGAVAMQGIVGRGLVGDDVGAGAACLHALDQFGEDLGGIAEEAHGFRLAFRGPVGDEGEGFVQRFRLGVEIAGADAEIDAGFVHLYREAAGACHDGGEGLRAAHPAKAAGQDPAARQVAAVMLASGLGEGFIGALDDALGADVDPRSGGHLAVHGQSAPIKFVEVIPCRPVWDEIRIRDQDAGGVLVGAEDADGFAGLHEQGFIVVQGFQRGDDAVEILPRPRGAADAAIDHQFMRVFGDVGMQVVHQHAHRRLGQPAFGGDFRAGRGEDVAEIVTLVHGGVPSERGQLDGGG